MSASHSLPTVVLVRRVTTKFKQTVVTNHTGNGDDRNVLHTNILFAAMCSKKQKTYKQFKKDRF